MKAKTDFRAAVNTLENQIKAVRHDIRYQVRDNVSVETRADAELEKIREYYREHADALFSTQKQHSQQEIEDLALAGLTPDQIMHHGRNNIFSREMDGLLAEEPKYSLFRMDTQKDQATLANFLFGLEARGRSLIERTDQSAAMAVRQSHDERIVLYGQWQQQRLVWLAQKTAEAAGFTL